MASTRTIATGGLVNFSNGLCRITTLVEKIDTTTVANDRPIEIYSALVTIPDTGVDIPFDTILGKTRELNNVFDTSGAFATVTSGNEIVNEKTLSLTFANDFVYYSETPKDTAVLSNNILLRMLSGDKFTLPTVADTVYKVIGTNGSVKREKLAISDQKFGKLFEQDGKLIIPNASEDNGDTKLQDNTVVKAFNNFNITVMIEFMYQYTSNLKECYRYVYTIPGEIGLTEGDDYNKFTSNVQVLCDVRTTDRFFVDGIVADDKTRFEATSIAVAAGTEKDITLAANGVVEFGTGHNITIGNYDIGDCLAVYVLDLGTHGAGKTGYLIVEKTDASTWTAVPVLLTQNGVQATAGVAETDFIIPIYDFDFIQKKFIQL